MSNIYTSTAQLIGRTPLLELTNIEKKDGLNVRLHAAIQLAKRPENAGKTIVVLLPGSGERYLTTAMYAK